MTADIEREIVLIALITEQRIALTDCGLVHVRRESFEFTLLGGESPGVEIQVELVLINDELLEAQDATVRLQRVDVLEPLVLAPGPEAGREDVGQNEAVEQFRKDKNLHIRQGDCGGVFFELISRRSDSLLLGIHALNIHDIFAKQSARNQSGVAFHS